MSGDAGIKHCQVSLHNRLILPLGFDEINLVGKLNNLTLATPFPATPVLGTFSSLVSAGTAIGAAAAAWLEDPAATHVRLAALPSPYGDGTSARRSLAAISILLSQPLARRRAVR